MENLGEARLVTRSGAMLFAGAGLVAGLNTFLLDLLHVAGVDVVRMRALALLSFASAGIALLIPWDRLPRRASGVLAVVGLGLLLASGEWTGYAATDQARVAYPAFFLLIFGWLGLTQPRGTSATFAPIAALGCAWLTWSTPHVTVSLAGLLIAIMTSVLISEIMAWAMARSRRHADDLGTLVSASSELREVLSLAEGADLAAGAAKSVLHADRVELLLLESGVVPSERLAPALRSRGRGRGRDRCGEG